MKTQGQFLKHFYVRFQKNRSTLSQRAFAQFLGIAAPLLHYYMNDKRILPTKLAELISARLNLSESEKQPFLEAVRRQRERTQKRKEKILRLSVADFVQISDWYYFAILALADTIDFQSDPRWISSRLNITESEAGNALKTLQRIGFFEQVEDRLVLSQTQVETEADIPSEALRKSHKQSLFRTMSAMDEIHVDEREIESVTFAGDPQRLRAMKRLIRAFSQKVMSQMESGCRSEVYELNIQLLPISRRIPLVTKS